MSDLHIIHILKGYGPLKFGFTQDQVKEALGEPDEIEKIDEGELFQTLIWHYWCFDISVFFDLNEDSRLTAIETDHNAATLWDASIFQLPEKDVLELFANHGHVDYETEMEGGEKCISFDDACTDLYFQDGRLSSVNFGVINDEE